MALISPQAGTAQGSAGPQKPAGPEQRPADPPAAAAADLPISLDRIRRALENDHRLRLDPQPPESGTKFKVRIEENYFKFPTFAESLRVPRMPVPPGGLYHDEFMRMVTPEAVRGSAPYTNGEMLQVAATSLVTALAVQGVVAAVRGVGGAIRGWQAGQARREVQQELAEFKRQAAAAAEKTTTSPEEPQAAKKPPVKKSDKKKT